MNIPTRIAFTVSSSRLTHVPFSGSGWRRNHCWGWGICSTLGRTPTSCRSVSMVLYRDQEAHAVVQDWKARGRPQYVDGITSDSETKVARADRWR
ncbi:hypothetical protein ACLK19_06155 [Escherichia coli]